MLVPEGRHSEHNRRETKAGKRKPTALRRRAVSTQDSGRDPSEPDSQGPPVPVPFDPSELQYDGRLCCMSRQAP